MKHLRPILLCLFVALILATFFACSANLKYEPQDGGTIVSEAKLTVVNGVVTDTENSEAVFSLMSRVSVSATVPGGKVFSHWTQDTQTDPISESNPYVFNIDKTMTLTAHFEDEPQKFDITVENGTITGKSVTSASFAAGESVSVTASAPSEGKRFAGWAEVGSTEIISTSNPYVFTVRRAISLIATYIDVIRYTVSVTGGYIGTNESAVTATFEPNASVTVTAIIPEGKVFDGWKVGNASSPSVTANPYVFSIAANVTLTAVFSDEIIPVRYRVSVENGLISGQTPDTDGYYWFEEGTSATAVANNRTDSSKLFDFWRQNGEEVAGAESTYTFTVNEDIYLRAYYTSTKRLLLTDSRVISVNGEATDETEAYYSLGSEVTLAPIVDSGERFICWIDGITQTLLSQTQTFNLTLDRERNIRAVVVPIPQEGYRGVSVIGGKFYTNDTYSTLIDGDASYQTIPSGSNRYIFFKTDTITGCSDASTINYYNGTSFNTATYPSAGFIRNINSWFSGSVVFIPEFTLNRTATVSVTDGNGYIDDDTTISEKVVDYGTEVTVTPKTIADKLFKEWIIDGDPVDESLLSTDGSYTFKLWEDTVLSAVYESIATVTTVGGTIKGGGTSESVTVGSLVTVVADEAGDNRLFRGWFVGSEKVSGQREYTFRVEGDITLTATFEVLYLVTVHDAQLTIDGEVLTSPVRVEYGEEITISVVVPEGKRFAKWTSDAAGNNLVSQSNPYTFTVSADTTLYAIFIGEYTVSVVNGTILFNGNDVGAQGKFVSGDSVTVRPNTLSDKRFKEWLIDGITVSTNEQYTFTVSADTTVHASFNDEYTVSVVNGTLSFNGNDIGTQGKFVAGDSVILRPNTVSGKSFKQWLVNGLVISTVQQYTFTVSESVQFEAEYSDLLSVTLHNSRWDDEDDVLVTYYAEGESATVSAVSTVARSFQKWTSDPEGNNLVSSVTPYTFTVTVNVHLYAHFAVSNAITVKFKDNYTGEFVGEDYIVLRNVGNYANLTPTVPSSYRVNHWLDSDGNVIQNTENAYSYYVMYVTENMTFTVILTHILSVSVVGGKFTDNTTSKDLDCGSTANVYTTARNAKCQNFDSWMIGGNSLSSSLNYSFVVEEDTVITAKYGLIYSQKNVVGDTASENNIANYTDYYAGGSQGFIIPGLSDEENIVIQGIDYSETLNWMFVTGYVGMRTFDGSTVPCYSGSPTGNTNSVIFILDMAQNGPNGCKGKFIKEIILSNVDGTDYKGEAGGIAVTAKNLFVTKGDAILRMALSKITDTNDTTYRLAFDEEIRVPVNASYCTFDDTQSVLWVGEFEYGTDYPTSANHKTTYNGVEYTGWSVGYILNESGAYGYDSENGFSNFALSGLSIDGATPDYILWHDNSSNTSGTVSGGKVQGIAFAGNKIAVSRSWLRDGKTAGSADGIQELRIYTNEAYGSTSASSDGTVTLNGVAVNYWYLDNAEVVETAPMNEDLATYYDSEAGKYYVYVAADSACYKYRNGDGGGYSAHPADFAWKYEVVQ